MPLFSHGFRALLCCIDCSKGQRMFRHRRELVKVARSLALRATRRNTTFGGGYEWLVNPQLAEYRADCAADCAHPVSRCHKVDACGCWQCPCGFFRVCDSCNDVPF